VYLWPLYGFLGVQWLLVSDAAELFDLRRRRRSNPSIPKLGRGTVTGIWLGKVLHVGWALVLPLIWYPWWAVGLGYLVASWCIGFALAVTFQIAHCVDRAAFELPDSARRGNDYVWHQLKTTVNVTDPSLVDFARLFLGVSTIKLSII
jgi:linoleoyl-CoA desaturase